MGNTKHPPIIGPPARMRCRRCGRVFSVKPGHLIAHDRRQGAMHVPCDGVLAPVVPGDTRLAGSRASTDR